MRYGKWLVGSVLVASAALAGPATAGVERVGSVTNLVESSVDEAVLVFRDGKRVSGTILEESETEIRMRVTVAGIAAETTYQKSEILTITRTEGAAAQGGAATEDVKPTRVDRDPVGSRPGAKKVYVIPLKGVFGEHISQTPIRQAIADAQRNEADYLVFRLENEWSAALFGGLEDEQLSDDTSAFDELFRAEEIEPVITKEIPRNWEKQPEIIFWVENAMGGAAFLPLITPNIYFSSDARMGGVGGLAQMFEGVGDEVVREKQRSLRLGHAQGMALQGGHDVRVVNAMTRMDYVLSYNVIGGRPVFYERMPEGPFESLLTDDGTQGEFADSTMDRVTGDGNDVLTLRAEVARKIGVSKGTVDSLDDLLFELGIHRNHELVDGSAQAIMDRWRDGIDSFNRDLRALWAEFGDIEVQGEYNERKSARGAQIRKLRQIQQLCEKYGEAVDPRQFGFPPVSEVKRQIAIIELEQLADQR